MLRLLQPLHRQRPDTNVDKKLARRVATVLERDLADIDLSGIRFFVREGNVEIRGIVARDSDRRLLDTIIGRIDGMERVVNRALTVRSRVHYLAPSRAA